MTVGLGFTGLTQEWVEKSQCYYGIGKKLLRFE